VEPGGDPAPAPPSDRGLRSPRGGGKSTWAVKLADHLAAEHQHRIFIVNAEEAHAPTMAARLRRLEITREGILIAGNIDYPSAKAAAQEHECEVLVLDSWSSSSWTGADLDRARRDFVVILTLHVTKAGDPGGPQAILHAADITVEIDQMKATISKSRWSGALETPVLHE